MLLHRSSNVFENSTNILNSTTTWYQQYDHVSLNCQLVLHIKVFGDIVERKDSYWNTLLEFNCVFSLNNFPGPINISALSLSFIQEFGQNLLELYIIREGKLFVRDFLSRFFGNFKKKRNENRAGCAFPRWATSWSEGTRLNICRTHRAGSYDSHVDNRLASRVSVAMCK